MPDRPAQPTTQPADAHPSEFWSPMPPMLNCAVCGDPIMWCLDMFSYTCENPHRLAHARCVWTPEAFGRQARLARVSGQPAAAKSSATETTEER